MSIKGKAIMKETEKDVLNLLENDTPENRKAFEEKYGSFFLNVLASTLVGSYDMSSKFKGSSSKLVQLIASYKDPSVIEPLKRAFRRDARGTSKTIIIRAISQFQDQKATQFLISLMGSNNQKNAKTSFKQYPYHLEMLKSLKPELVDEVLADEPKPAKVKLQCYRCGRTADKVKILRCGMCGRPFCVDHNYYNGYCSITCAK